MGKRYQMDFDRRTITQERGSQREPNRLVRWMLPIMLAVMLIEVTVVAGLLRVGRFGGGADGDGSPVAAVAQPTVVAPATTPPTPGAPPTAAPTARTEPTPVRLTPGPLTATTVAPAPPPEPAAPAAPAPSIPRSGPAETVSAFYRLVEQHAFDRAVQLWSQRMRDEYPPAENLWGRFEGVQQMIVRRSEVTTLDEATGRASVAVDVVEVDESARTRRYLGTWYLVRGGSTWLLDQPSLQPAPVG